MLVTNVTILSTLNCDRSDHASIPDAVEHGKKFNLIRVMPEREDV